MENEISRKELAELVFKALNRRDFAILEPYMDNNLAIDFPGAGRIEGIKKALIFLKALLRKYPLLVFKVSDVLVDGDRMCAIWTNEGKDSMGNPYSNRGNTIINVVDGKVTLISDYFKDTSFTAN